MADTQQRELIAAIANTIRARHASLDLGLTAIQSVLLSTWIEIRKQHPDQDDAVLADMRKFHGQLTRALSTRTAKEMQRVVNEGWS